MRTLRILIILLLLSIPSQVLADCFCINTSTLSFAPVEVCSSNGNHVVPSCGQLALQSKYEYAEWYRVKVAGNPTNIPVMSWVDNMWQLMSDRRSWVTEDFKSWASGLAVCPDDPYEPITDPAQVDTDNDGIPDVCDPWPNENNAGSMWTPVFSWSDGGMTFHDEANNKWLDLGSCDGQLTLLLGYDSIEFTSLMNQSCDPYNPSNFAERLVPPEQDPPVDGGDSGNSTSEDRPPATKDPTDGGPADGGSSGDAHYIPYDSIEWTDTNSTCCPELGVIAKNSGMLVEGQNDVRDYLAALQASNANIAAINTQVAGNSDLLVEGQDDMRGYLAAIQTNTAYLRGDMLTVADGIDEANSELSNISIGIGAVEDKLSGISTKLSDVSTDTNGILANTEAIKNNTGVVSQDIQDSAGQATGSLAEVDTAIEGLEFTNYTNDDVPDSNAFQIAYENAINDFISTSEVAGVADDIGVSLSSPVSSLSITVWGSNIVFDFAPWESIFDLIGVAFLSLCYLTGFFLILRG